MGILNVNCNNLNLDNNFNDPNAIKFSRFFTCLNVFIKGKALKKKNK